MNNNFWPYLVKNTNNKATGNTRTPPALSRSWLNRHHPAPSPANKPQPSRHNSAAKIKHLSDISKHKGWKVPKRC